MKLKFLTLIMAIISASLPFNVKADNNQPTAILVVGNTKTTHDKRPNAPSRNIIKVEYFNGIIYFYNTREMTLDVEITNADTGEVQTGHISPAHTEIETGWMCGTYNITAISQNGSIYAGNLIINQSF